jgi:steroid delta-isomerase-like uncharacterized protein
MARDVKKMIDDYILAWNSHDINKIISFFTDDCIYENLAHGKVYHGKKEVTASFNSIMADFPDLKFEVKSVFVAGDWAGQEWVMSGTHAHSSNPAIKATGKTFSVRGATIYQLRDGKISRESDYYNLATIMQQLGLMPGQPK